MSSENLEKKTIVSNKGEKIFGKLPTKKSPFKKDKLKEDLNRNDININPPNKEIDFLESSTNNFIHDITQEKKSSIPTSKKPDLMKFNKDINKFIFNSKNIIPINIKDISLLTDSNIFDNNSSISNITTSKNNINKIKKNSKNQNNNKTDKNIDLNNKITTSLISNNTSSGILNDNISYQTETYDSNYSNKISKIKDDYIDFLQKEFEDNTKKSVKLDSNNKELLKKCDELIQENKILNNSLNDRTSKLNKTIQENLMIKSELDKSLLNNQKNEQKLQFYEEQFNLFKTTNDNYQKIIQELKEKNAELNHNLEEMVKINEENLKSLEEDFRTQLKEKIENSKREIEELYENRNREDLEKNEKKITTFMNQIKELEEKNEELINELTNKSNMFDRVSIENEKLTSENNLFRTQIDQYSLQIGELNTIIENKDIIINNLKTKSLSNNKLINKSSSYSIMKSDGSEYINENISKLINNNEENKKRIELLNDKIKSIDEIEKKYNEIMNGSKTLSLAYHMNSNNTSPKNLSTKFNYNNLNDIKISTNPKNSGNKYNDNNFTNYISPKKLDFIDDISDKFSSPISKNNYEKIDYNNQIREYKAKKSNKINNLVIFSSNKTKEIKRINNKNNNSVNSINSYNNSEIKLFQKENKNIEKANKNIGKIKKVEKNISPIKSRYYHKIEENKIKESEKKEIKIGKELELEKDEIKEYITEMNRKQKNIYKPKVFNYSSNEMDNSQKNGNELFTIGNKITNKIDEENQGEQNSFYLYGIDRNDNLHIFNVNEKKWCDMVKIIDFYDKSDTFKKDYQYEGTLLYNTLYGVYILTGKKTDILYYLNSKTNNITKICKFNNCHDNGSIMLDMNSNCLYVFGGKKINSCEYYSFKDKKVYKLPDLITDRANASFIVSNNKIFGFFGFCYSKNNYANSIEYIDFNKRDKWYELKNIQLLKSDISFDIESISTMYYRQNQNLILIYCGIQGEEEDFVTEYYLLYDSKNNTMDKINKWNMQQYKSIGKKWKSYNFKKNDPKGFHFAKNTRFILLPKDTIYEGYNEKEPIDIMIDYKNNVHFILQENQKIDVYRSDM